MRCLVCDAEMDLAEVVPDDTMPVPGYEHYTFRCPQCGDEERRLLFARAGESQAAEAEPSASKPPVRQPDEPALSAAFLADLESQLAGPVSAAAPVQPGPARPRPSLLARLGKLVTAIRSLPAAALRRGKPSIGKTPPSSGPMPDQPLPSPAALPALQPSAVAPMSSVAESPVAELPEPARGSPDPDAVLAALAAIAALARQPAEPASPLSAPHTAEPEVPEPVASAPASTAGGSHPDEASSVAPLAAASEPTVLRVSAAPAPVLTPYRGEAESTSVAPHAPPSEPAPANAPFARAPEPTSAPPLPVTSKPEAGEDEEDLLRRAIEILDGPTPAAQPASAAAPKPAAAAKPTAPAKRADKATHAKQAKQSLPSRAVRVERAPDDATMYLAKDVTSGLTVMSHPDTAHLRKMCDWIGWEVVEE